jgi:inorganic triphosphatase YgiF
MVALEQRISLTFRAGTRERWTTKSRNAAEATALSKATRGVTVAEGSEHHEEDKTTVYLLMVKLTALSLACTIVSGGRFIIE